VAAALPGWTPQVAILHTLEGAPAWLDGQDAGTTIFTRETAPDLGHLPPALRDELDRALAGRPATRFVQGQLPADAPLPDPRSVPVAASWHEGLPVSFCYAVTETGRWWDVSIETLPAYRGRGLAARAARAMTRLMWRRGKAPVWGAMAENAASRALAGRLGFVETARLAVFTSPR
jgi:GNAT superfamily N-acetyltransferase